MQSLDPKTGENQSNTMVPIPGITLSESWRSAFGKLVAGSLSDARALILIGERGVGKASLIDAWREQSGSAFRVLVLDDATGEPDLVVVNLAHLMGVDTADMGRGAILSAITDAVRASRKVGQETVVIVDNADDVPSNTVELLMILSRDRGTQKPLLRYIFSGSAKLHKTLRLDSGAARRQNYVTIELERFTPEETKTFVVANLSRVSDVTITDDAVMYLHESTSGKPANILTVIDKVRHGRMAKDETEITLAHIQSLVKAPRAVGPSPKKLSKAKNVSVVDGDGSSPSVAKNGSPPALQSGSSVEQPAASQAEDKSKAYPEPGNVFATNSDLPDSIRNVNDPRPLLRWAFGLEEHSETEALANRAEAVAAARSDDTKRSDQPIDINAALAKVAERERSERNPKLDVVPVPKPQAEGTLDHMIQGEAFAFEASPSQSVGVVKDPDELKNALREVPHAPRQRSKKIVLAGGVALLGMAALGFLWSALQPSSVSDPLAEQGTIGQTAALSPQGPQPAQSELEGSNTASLVLESEPDLETVIARLKSPELSAFGARSASIVPLFRDDTPRVVRAGYLSPTGVNSSTENAVLRQAILDDMATAERIELAGEGQRLMEQLAELEEEVTQKRSLLISLERAVGAMSTQAQQSGDLIDNRKAEIEVVTSRLAFMARDRSQAARRLASASTEVETVEERLQAMRGELVAAEALVTRSQANTANLGQEVSIREAEYAALNLKVEEAEALLVTRQEELAAAQTLISENQVLWDQNQAVTANLDKNVAEREAQFAALNLKVEEAEALLATRQDDLTSILAQQEEAETQLTELSVQLQETQTAQQSAKADLEALVEELGVRTQAFEALNAQVSEADARLNSANTELATASAALDERTAALDQIETQAGEAQSKLDVLIAEVESRDVFVTTSNQELDRLSAEREAFEAELAEKAGQIEVANGQLEALTANQQTASSEFEALSERKVLLQGELETGEVVLETLSAELDTKQTALNGLVSELDAGAAKIAAQRQELETLQAQTAAVVAAQTTAQAAVEEEQSQVASASNDLVSLKSRQTELAAALIEIEDRTAASRRELQTVEANKLNVENDVASAEQRLNEIKVQEAEAEKGLASFEGEFKEKTSELEDIENRIAASNRELTTVATRKAALNAELAELTDAGTAKLREQQADIDELASELKAKQDALASINQELSRAQTAVAAVEPSSMETATVPAIRVRPAAVAEISTTAAVLDQAEAATETAAPQSGIALSGRSADLVISALADAPGLGRAPQAKKDELQAALIRGECVTDALKGTFGRVNPHTLVALLETMEMCGS